MNDKQTHIIKTGYRTVTVVVEQDAEQITITTSMDKHGVLGDEDDYNKFKADIAMPFENDPRRLVFISGKTILVTRLMPDGKRVTGACSRNTEAR